MKDIENIIEERLVENNEIKDAILSCNSEVRRFYENTVVFVTGGSGFVGKQLIEKLIRSCNIKKIFVFLRVKKGKSIHERLRAILDDPVYEELHRDQPDFVEKLVPIEGDSEKENIGINEKDWKILSDEVNVIFHAAATINFQEPMKTATFINVRGTREILNLAKACKHIKSVVYVSTAYAHATRNRVKDDVKEDFYNSPIAPEILIDLAENMNNDKLTAMIKPLMQEWPNTYTFTKAVAEELVRVMGEDLPVCIVRPAIVISAYREPCLGWIDVRNVYGVSGMVLGTALGLLHTTLSRDEINIDFIPVDIVNNVTIVAAWETYHKYTAGDKQTNIYTVTSNRKPITYGEFTNMLNNESRNIVPSQAVWYCFGIKTSNKFIHLILTWLLHYIPGIVIDGCCLLIGQKPRLLKIYKMVYSMSSVFAYFLNNDWIFHDANTLELHNKLSQTDMVIYNCDMSSVDMKELTYIWSYGVRRFIVKDDLKTRNYAQIKQKLLKIAHYILFPLYLYALFKLLLGSFSCIFYFFVYCVNMFIAFKCM